MTYFKTVISCTRTMWLKHKTWRWLSARRWPDLASFEVASVGDVPFLPRTFRSAEIHNGPNKKGRGTQTHKWDRERASNIYLAVRNVAMIWWYDMKIYGSVCGIIGLRATVVRHCTKTQTPTNSKSQLQKTTWNQHQPSCPVTKCSKFSPTQFQRPLPTLASTILG